MKAACDRLRLANSTKAKLREAHRVSHVSRGQIDIPSTLLPLQTCQRRTQALSGSRQSAAEARYSKIP